MKVLVGLGEGQQSAHSVGILDGVELGPELRTTLLALDQNVGGRDLLACRSENAV